MQSLSPQRLTELKAHANNVRQGIIRSLLSAGSGHSAGSLDMADIFTALYFHVMKHDPKIPMMEDRDRLLLSCGHITPVRYSAMAYAGYFPVEELLTLRFDDGGKIARITGRQTAGSFFKRTPRRANGLGLLPTARMP